MPLYDIRLSCLTSGGRFSWNFKGNVDNTTTPAPVLSMPVWCWPLKGDDALTLEAAFVCVPVPEARTGALCQRPGPLAILTCVRCCWRPPPSAGVSDFARISASSIHR